MPSVIKIFFIGMFVSFLGELPLGTLNIAAMQISISEGIKQAFLFALGVLTIEVIYVRVSLVAFDWIRRQQKILKMLEWFTLLIVLALAASSFYAALHPGVHKSPVLSSTLPKYILGLTLSAVNPVQIPFWFGWSTVLFTKKILLPKNSHYNSYIIGIGLGTIAGSCLYIFGGSLIVDKLKANQHILSWVIGGIFVATAIIQLVKIVRRKDLVHNVEHPEEVIENIEKKMHN